MNEDKLDAQESTQPENNQVENTPIENVQIEPAPVETVQVEETQENTPVADSTVYDQARADDATYNNDAPVAGAIRINKFLASCGVESRRAADKLIEEGRVEVNGKVVEAPGIRVTTEDFVKLDGHRMTPKEEVVVLLNKPRGYVCSRDAQGAEGTVFDLMPPRLQHLNYVGRLDADSEGLIVMTNKGDFAQTLSHPTEGIEKEYWVTVDQNFDNSVLMQFLKGVRIPEGQAKAKYVCRSSARRACIVLEQGLKRQVRQMFACLGLRVRKLVRVRIGSLWGGELAEGSWRLMDAQDMELASHNPKQPKKYLGARELAGYKGTSTRLASNKPTSGVEDDESYEFNPADFEGVDFDADTCELTPDMKTIFSEAVETEKDYSQIDENAERQFSDVRRERSFGGRPTEGGDREGGFRERREGGFGGPRREGGFGGPRREGGFGGPRREGGFGGPRREGGFGGPRREGGGFGERREGGFGGPRREGGFGGPRREGGFGGPRREGGGFGGPRREGGGFGERREGGFGGPRREGGFGGPRREGGGFGERREGGFGGPRREGGFGGPRREGGGFGGPRREGGGFGGPRREGGGFGGPRREGGGFGGPRREGGGFGGDRDRH